jgi:hypothetical protein
MEESGSSSERRQTTNSIRKIVGYNLAFSLRAYFAARPALYFNSLRLIGKDMSAAVTDQSDILLAGIYGCANTYAHDALGESHPELQIAHHMHVPAQVLRAVKLSIPILILIRYPLDCIASYTTRGGMQLTLDDMRWGLKDFAYYYDSIIDLREHFVTTDFAEIVSDYPAAIRRLNERFGTRLSVPANDSEEAKAIVARNKFKGTQRKYVLEDVKTFLKRPELEAERARAIASYERFCDMTGTPQRKDPPRPPIAVNPEKTDKT